MGVRDFRAVPRSSLSLGVLPNWPKWVSDPAAGETLSPGETYVAILSGKPVLAVATETSQVLYCQLKEIPTIAVTPSLNAEPKSSWIIEGPEWKAVPVKVDMSPIVDLMALEDRYMETLFGAPLAIFVKSSLMRATATAEKDKLVARLQELIKPTQELSSRYTSESNITIAPQYEKMYQDWKQREMADGAHAAAKSLLKRETQLQVLLLLQLLVLEQPAEAMLDDHFDRLCIWQAIDATKVDEVVQFCSQIIMPFYRSSLPATVKALVKRSRGVAHARQKPKAAQKSGSSTRPGVGATAFKPGTSVFSDAVRAIRAKSMSPVPSDMPRPGETQELEPKKAVRTISKGMQDYQRRQVNLSLGPIAARQVSVTKAPGGPRRNKSEPSRRVTSEPVLVEATPSSHRTIRLPLESIPLDLEAIDSTDSDGD